MSRSALILLTLLALLAFAGNSLLCRLALATTAIDAASFTALRLTAGALMLGLLVRQPVAAARDAGSWPSALALFAYAVGFSFAYLDLTAATGALLLFAAVQAAMTGYGLWRGERLTPLQWCGIAFASAGLVTLLLPGLAAPPPAAALLMLPAPPSSAASRW
ncbi:MAG: family transporter [Moraxellaceae bacterium]|nr:family transporter [Moraxellaceae bacterium]